MLVQLLRLRTLDSGDEAEIVRSLVERVCLLQRADVLISVRLAVAFASLHIRQ